MAPPNFSLTVDQGLSLSIRNPCVLPNRTRPALRAAPVIADHNERWDARDASTDLGRRRHGGRKSSRGKAAVTELCGQRPGTNTDRNRSNDRS